MAFPSEKAGAPEKLYTHPSGLSCVLRGKSWSLRGEDGDEIARGIGSEALVAALAPLRSPTR
jgi:hypothetical protein